jgi:hypothetical protein
MNERLRGQQMSHWFDDLTKALSSASITPRRSFLQILGLSAANISWPIVFSRPASAQSADGCAWTIAGNVISREIQATQDALSVKRTLSYDRARRTAEMHATLLENGALVAQLDIVIARGGAVTANASYGPRVTGAKAISLKSADGKTFAGQFDGRPVRRLNNRLVLGDGTDAPSLVLEPSLRAALEGLRGRAMQRGSGTCRTEHTLHPHDPNPATPGSDWYEPDGVSWASCQGCQDGCYSTYQDQALSFSCYFLNPFCEVEATAQWAICMGLCQLPGNGCLPVPCGTLTTCGPGDTCFSFKGGRLCCAAPSALCNNVCCGKDVTTCAPNGLCGCATGLLACGNKCCDGKTSVCSNGICCPKGQVNHNGKCCTETNLCGKVCCDELATCGDPKKGICCPFLTSFCAGKCCDQNQVCINGSCCPKERSCGGVCCPSGHKCSDPVKKTCTACPATTVPCLPSSGASICCAPNVACCPGICCQPGQSCNSAGPGKFVCGPPQVIK